MFRDIMTCFGKEFNFYFRSKMIYLLLFVYLAMSAGFTFYLSDFYQKTTVNLYQFFKYQPAILALIVPALAMRLWADEYKNNTLEVLFAQPVNPAAAAVGKFLAVWAVSGLMLVMSWGMWLAVAVIVPLDNCWILANYLITFLAAGSLCALSSAAAAFCYNMLGAFLASFAVCLVVTTADFSLWLGKLSGADGWQWLRFVKAFDFAGIFNDMIMGQAGLSGMAYFVILIAAALGISVAAADYKRS